MRILYIGDETIVYDSVKEFQNALDNEDISADGGWGGTPDIFELPDNLPRVKVEEVEVRSRFIVTTSEVETLATAGTLPAPMEGETVGAYARRITGA
jgi:hypothetical protein